MPRILIAGAPTGCWTNLGDEAIFAGMAGDLRAAIPGADFHIVSSNPEGFLDAHNATSVPYGDIDRLARAVARSDLVLLGGGSIFFDYWGCDPSAVLTPRHEGLTLWASVALLAADARKPLMVYGAGVGPLRTDNGRLVASAVFELADRVTLRDADSARALGSLSIERVAPTVTGDPALGLDLSPAGPVGVPRPLVGVALRQWDVGVDPERWQSGIAASLDRFLEAHGGTALFVPCHRGVDWPLTDDTAVGEAVRARMKRRAQTEHVSIDLPWRVRAAILAGCNQVLAMRYHAALFAMVGGVAPIAVSYDPKVDALLGDAGLDSLRIGLPDVASDTLSPLLERGWQERLELSAATRSAITRMRARQQENATLATALVAGQRPPKRGGKSAAALRAVRNGTAGRRGQGKRVAILTNRLLDWETGQPCFGGAEHYALELARLLRDLDLATTFFQLGHSAGVGDYFGFPVVSIPPGERFSEFETGVSDGFFHATKLFDHVLYLTPHYASGTMREEAVVVCHGVWWDHDLYTKQFAFRSPEWHDHLRRVFTRPRRVVSVDANSINVVRSLFPEAAPRMALIPNWVDVDRFRPPSERRNPQPVVIFPRRAEIVRGTRLVGPILDAIPEDCRVVWVGDGYPGELAVLRDVASRDSRFRLETASFDGMPEVYRKADVCVIPTVGSEGQSLACLEAMASGCAIVSTHIGGLPELVQDGVTGLLCEPEAASLASAIRRLLADAPLRHLLGANARLAAERHSLAAWRAKWSAVLSDLGWLSARQSDTPPIEFLSPARSLVAADPEPYDIVCFSIINWEFRYQRPQQMMSVWAKRGRRVFYLRMTDFLPREGPALDVRPLRENVWEVRISLPGDFDVYSGVMPDRHVKAGLEALRILRKNYGITRAVSVVEIATWTPLAQQARAAFQWSVLYDCMDDWKKFPGLADRPQLLEAEERLVAASDVMVVSSGLIAARWSDRRPDLLLARNAADFAFFHNAADEDPLPDIHGPIAGFFGAIAGWFDVELVARAARARPGVTFVLIGGVFDIDVKALERLPNVRLLGQQPYERMPAYLRRFDACLVPFVVTELTAAVDAVKFYEYLSQGKPVVSTPIESALVYRQYAYVASGPEEFVRQLDAALAEDDPDLCRRRISFAKSNTWEERITRIDAAIGASLRAQRQLSGRLAEQGEMIRELSERELRASQEVLRIQEELLRWRSTRLWRLANVYWRGRRFAGRLLRRWRRRSPAARLPDSQLNTLPDGPAVFDIVCFPVIDWGFRFQRPQQLMTRLGASGCRVFYLSNDFRGHAPYELRPLSKNVSEVTLRARLTDVYRKAPSEEEVDELFGSLDALRRDVGLAATVSVVQLPFWWPLGRRAAERWGWPVVYDCMDHHPGFHTRYPQDLIELEQNMLRSSQLVLASSRSLCAEASAHNVNTLLLPNACDFDHFAAVRKVPSQSQSVVGYYGAIGAWFDADLVADLAERRPDWRFLVVGSTTQGDTSRLARLPNVKLAGEQPYASLPHWLERMDVLIIPFQITPLTRATNPVKIYEMLAAGKPVVSAPLPELEPMAPLVRFASSAEEFEREIAAALAGEAERGEELAAERRAFARRETWDSRIEALAPRLAGVFPRVSVVIVTFNNLELSRQCLESLFEGTSWPNLEVFVIDNASTDGTKEWLRSLAETYRGLTVILNSDNRGFAAANNQGLAQASGDILVLLNNDTVLSRGWLAALVRHLHSDPSIGLIGPVTNAVGNEAKVEVGYTDVADMPSWAARYVRDHDGERFEIPMLAMFCLAMRREVFDRVGPLDERYDVGMFEDDDYTLRVRHAGFRIVCARDAFVHHWQRAAFGKLADEEYQRIWDSNQRRFEEKWGIVWQPHRGPFQS